MVNVRRLTVRIFLGLVVMTISTVIYYHSVIHCCDTHTSNTWIMCRVVQCEEVFQVPQVQAYKPKADSADTANADHAQNVDIFSQRRKVIAQSCKSYKSKHSKKDRGWYVAHKQLNLLICPVPKVASTFWQILMSALGRCDEVRLEVSVSETGEIIERFTVNQTNAMKPDRSNVSNLHRDSAFKTVSVRNNISQNALTVMSRGCDLVQRSYRQLPVVDPVKKITWGEVDTLFPAYTRIVYARNPYERLYSAYLDKMIIPNEYYWEEFGSLIAKYVRKSSILNDRKSSKLKYNNYSYSNVTFEEFLRLVIILRDKNLTFDVHIMPISKLCNICEMGYQNVVKMETFLRDTKKISADLGLERYLDVDSYINVYPQHEIWYNVDVLVESMYKQRLNECISDVEAVERLWNTFKYRGKISPDFPVPDIEDITIDDQIDSALLVNQINSAIRKSRSNKKARSDFKRSSYVKAYEEVGFEYKTRISDVYREDFVAFMYDTRPPDYIPVD